MTEMYKEVLLYSRCISCRAPLGSNDVLEQFPVGRRLAFDPAKGRLWVLCRSCRGWNLVPLEERWEAVEKAEDLFRRAQHGAATENIGLRRVREGTELIRVGRAAPPEFASWRYGERLKQRSRRYRWSSALVGAGVAAFGLGVPGLVAFGGGFYGAVMLRDRRPIMRTDDGRLIRRGEASRALLMADRDAGWRLIVQDRPDGDLVLQGAEALRALRALLPRINWGHWQPEHLDNAVAELERIGSADRLIRMAADDLADTANFDPRYRWGWPWATPEPHRIWASIPVIPLALEMAANDEAERRALEGEVAQLEREWRDAEELAAIADELLFPSVLRERIRVFRTDAGNA